MTDSYTMRQTLLGWIEVLPMTVKGSLQGHMRELSSMIARRSCNGCGEFREVCSCDGRNN
jgi:hypothetical protein